MRRGSSPTTTPNGCTRCGSARGDCARACHSVAVRAASATLVEPAIAEVKWLAGVLGTARDWDVFARETLPPLTAWFAQRRNDGAGTAAAPRRARGAQASRKARGATRAPRSPRGVSSGCCSREGSSARRRASGPDACPAASGGQPDALDGRAAISHARFSTGAIASFARLADTLGDAATEERQPGADRREAAPLRRRVLRSALSGQAGKRAYLEGADGAAGRARPLQRRRRRRRGSRASVRRRRATRPRSARCAAGSPHRRPRSNRTSRKPCGGISCGESRSGPRNMTIRRGTGNDRSVDEGLVLPSLDPSPAPTRRSSSRRRSGEGTARTLRR